jgi:hypothetical protein
MQRSESSHGMATLPENLRPMPLPDLMLALTPCLQLVAPVGMSVDDKASWFEAAQMALSHLPADMVRDAAVKAMRQADHPSKIVPIIIRETKDWYETRKSYSDIANKFQALPAPNKDNRSPSERKSIGDAMSKLVAKMQATAPDVDTVLGKVKP